jgi:hypothetical protein
MISELAMDVTTTGNRSYDDLTIWIGCTSQTEFATTNFAPLTNMDMVYYNQYYTTQVGWNVFDITGYDWDGNSNIIIQICSSNQDKSGGTSVRYTTTTPIYKTLYYNSSSVNACTNATGTRTYLRPNIRFTMCSNSFGAGATYSWSPATNLSNPSIADPVATVMADETYTVTVTDPANPGCPSTANIQVAVDPTNSVHAIIDTTICPGDAVDLNAVFSGPVPSTLACGANGTTCSTASYTTEWGTATTSGCCPTIYYGSQTDMKTQMLFRASDLQALGMSSGTITRIGWDVATKTSTGPYQNFTIRMACTNLTALTTTYNGGLTTVKNPGSVTTALGWNMHDLDNPYDWDGVSNLIVEVCYDNPAAIGYDYTRYSPAGYTALIRSYNSTNSTSGCAYGGTATYSYSNLANTRFVSCDAAAGTATYLWTPSADLNDPNIANPTATPNTPSTTVSYLVEVSGGVCTVYDTVNVTVCNPLPIELLSFEGYNNEDVNELSWITLSESNNDYFSVLRSIDGVQFSEIGAVDAIGNSIDEHQYRFTDHEPHVGMNYYKLKQVDIDGDYGFSNIIAINALPEAEINIFPNPTTKDLFIEIGPSVEQGEHQVMIVDISGKAISHELKVSADQQVYKVDDFSNVVPGIYIVKIFNEEGELLKFERITKQ